MAALPNIVLVHGAWADGSCWSNVIERLQADGYKVTAPQLPETSLADDVARVRHVLTRQSGPTVLAAHSYGGQVITSLGTDAPNVVGLVYIAAFGLDEGESIGALLQQGPPTPAVANVDIDSEGFGWIPEDDFLGHFAADIDPVKAKVMYAVQQPLHLSTFDDVMGAPAWKSLPSWYLVAENDEVIPPDAERQFAQRMGADTIEVASGRLVRRGAEGGGERGGGESPARRRLTRGCPVGSDGRWDRHRPRIHTRSRPTAEAGRTLPPAPPSAARTPTPAPPRCGRAG
jgi:pimeloyl-ACP methyl ester carboxylesterase